MLPTSSSRPTHFPDRLAALAFALAALASLLAPARAQTPKAVQLADQGVFRIMNIQQNGLSTGTGFMIGPDLVMTNHHVIDASEQLLVLRSAPPFNELLDAKIVAADPNFDMAVLRVPGLTGRRIKLSPALPPKGARVFSLGFPGLADLSQARDLEGLRRDLNYTVSTLTSGDVNRTVRDSWTGTGPVLNVIQHSAEVRHGNSGGPLLDECGRIAGINTRIRARESVNTIHLAAGVTDIRRFLDAAGVDYALDAAACGDADTDAPIIADDPPAPVPSGSMDRSLLLALAFGGIAVVGFGGIATFLVMHGRSGSRGGDASSDKGADASRAAASSYSDSTVDAETFRQSSEKTEMGAIHADSRWSLKVDGAGGRVGLRFTSVDIGRGLSIGRSADARFTIDDPVVSRRHAELRADGSEIQIVDLGSRNGTSINGRRLPPDTPESLRDGDLIAFGTARGRLQREG